MLMQKGLWEWSVKSIYRFFFKYSTFFWFWSVFTKKWGQSISKCDMENMIKCSWTLSMNLYTKLNYFVAISTHLNLIKRGTYYLRVTGLAFCYWWQRSRLLIIRTLVQHPPAPIHSLFIDDPTNTCKVQYQTSYNRQMIAPN